MSTRQISLPKPKLFFFLCLFFPFLFFLSLGHSEEEEIAKYPSRPINFIMSFPAGNSSDLAVRLIAKEAEKFIGQPIVVINRAGGAGTIGAAAIATAKPDGYTIGHLGASALFLVPHFQTVPYSTLNDFTYITKFGTFNIGVTIKADSPIGSFKGLIDYARNNPKKLTYGTTGVNSTQHLIMELIAKKEKIEMTHIPFKGASEAEMALLGGHVLSVVGDFSYSLIEAGQAKIILLFRSQKSVEYPQSPILKDFGYAVPEPGFLNVSGPKGLPQEIVKKIEGAFAKANKEPAFIDGMKKLHLPISYQSGKELRDYVVDNHEFWAKIVKESGLKSSTK